MTVRVPILLIWRENYSYSYRAYTIIKKRDEIKLWIIVEYTFAPVNSPNIIEMKIHLFLNTYIVYYSVLIT